MTAKEIKTLEQSAQKGDKKAAAQLNELGVDYQFGNNGKKVDLAQALHYYMIAAEGGNTNAMCNAAYCYATGVAGKVDAEKAFGLYQKAAGAGDLNGMTNLAGCYLNGFGTKQDAVEAINKTAALGIPTSAHLILGLPGETKQDMLNHAVKISELPITTLKLHQLQIVKQTKMAKLYEEDPSQFHLFSFEEYIELLCDFIALMRPEIVLERFVSQTPADLLIAPHWGLKNYEFSAKLEKYLRERNIHQGDRYKK